MTLAPVPRRHILNSWKEIATYLDRGVRTVQRWHAELSLPVHRIRGGNPRGSVFAYQEELDRWLQGHVRKSVVADTEQRLASMKESSEKISDIRKNFLSFWPELQERRTERQRRTIAGEYDRVRQHRFAFMQIDLDLASTLIKITQGASDAGKRNRNEANARRALDTVLELYRQSADLTDDERRHIDEKIKELRTALKRLTSQGAE